MILADPGEVVSAGFQRRVVRGVAKHIAGENDEKTAKFGRPARGRRARRTAIASGGRVGGSQHQN